MAVNDDKRRPYKLPEYGQTALAAAQSQPVSKPPAPKPRKQPGAEAALPLPQRAGLAINRGAQAVHNFMHTPLPGTKGIGATNRELATGIDAFARGVAGNASPIATAQAPAPARNVPVTTITGGQGRVGANALRRPTTFNVSGAANTVPDPLARGAGAPVVDGGGSGPATGAPASTPSLRPGDPNTYTGGNGVTRPVQPAAGGGVQAQSFGGAMPTMGFPQAPQVTMPALPGVNTGRVSAADRERQGAIGTIDEMIRGIGRPDMRSKRDLLATLMGQRGQLVGQAGQLAGAAAGQALDAAASIGNQFMAQDGANQRTVYDDAGNTLRTLIGDSGQTDRALLGLLPKPEYVTGADGKLRVVTGANAQAVGGEDGLQMPLPADANALRPQDVISAYDNARKAVIDSTPVGQQPDFSQIDGSPLGQAFAALFAGAGNSAGGGAASAPAVGTEQGGYRFKGGDPSDPANWQKVK